MISNTARTPSRRTWRALVVAAAWVVAFCSQEAQAAEESKKPFNVPEGDATATLPQYSVQAGGRLLYSTEAVAGVATKTVKGDFTPQQALQLMLAQTSLIAKRDEKTGAVVIVRVNANSNPAQPNVAKKKVAR